VAEEVGVDAAGVFQGVGEQREAVEGALVVYSPRKMAHTTIPVSPRVPSICGAERQ
jgi:hypothetical protein